MNKIDHPAHYGGPDNPREAIKVIESLGMGWGFALGSAIKYAMRAGRKTEDPVEDLSKAQWFLRRAVALASAGWDPIAPLDYMVSDRVAPDPDEMGKVVLVVHLDGPPVLLSSDAARSFLDGLELVYPGSVPVWAGEGRRWKGVLDPQPLRLPFTPFHLPLVVLHEERPATPVEAG